MCDYPDGLLWFDDGLCSGTGSEPICREYGGILATGPRHSVMRNREWMAETQIKCKMFDQGPGLSFVFRLYLINIPFDFRRPSLVSFTDNTEESVRRLPCVRKTRCANYGTLTLCPFFNLMWHHML
jgi:hypothetical protein